MELLFSHQHNHTITIPRYYDPSLALISPSTSSPTPPKEAPRPSEGRPTDIKFLIWWLKNYLMDDKDRPELFVQGETMWVFRICNSAKLCGARRACCPTHV